MSLINDIEYINRLRGFEQDLGAYSYLRDKLKLEIDGPQMRVVQGYRQTEEEVSEEVEETDSSSDERIMNEEELMANAFKRRKIGPGREIKI